MDKELLKILKEISKKPEFRENLREDFDNIGSFFAKNNEEFIKIIDLRMSDEEVTRQMQMKYSEEAPKMKKKFEEFLNNNDFKTNVGEKVFENLYKSFDNTLADKMKRDIQKATDRSVSKFRGPIRVKWDFSALAEEFYDYSMMLTKNGFSSKYHYIENSDSIASQYLMKDKIEKFLNMAKIIKEFSSNPRAFIERGTNCELKDCIKSLAKSEFTYNS